MEQAALARRIDRAFLAATLALGGIGFAVLAVVALIGRHPRGGDASLVYGASLAACSLASYVYNTATGARRDLLRFLDHGAIFLLIAGTVTPFAAGSRVLPLIWGLAIAGIALKYLLRLAYRRLFVGAYLALGWLGYGPVTEAAAAMPLALDLLVLGGIVYSAGAIVYALGRGGWARALWHGAVLVAALSHFLAVLVFIGLIP